MMGIDFQANKFLPILLPDSGKRINFVERLFSFNTKH